MSKLLVIFRQAGMNKQPNPFTLSPGFFVFFCLLAIALRLFSTVMVISNYEYNYDLECWHIASDIVLSGGNVYNETTRYSYAPMWMNLLAAIKASGVDFQYGLAVFLSIVDVLIAFILYRRKNHLAALLFLFSPISIIISGFHLQFDNLAVLIGLAGIVYVESRKTYLQQQLEDLSIKETVVFSLIIGLSLVTKHILFAFPVWLFFKTKRVDQKLLFFIIPVSVFLLSFLPYMAEGFAGIKNNVFNYKANNNSPFYNLFAPGMINMIGYKLHLQVEKEMPRLMFFALIAISGIYLRKKTLFELFVFYLACLIIFTSAILEEYMVIPVLFTAVYPNLWNVAYNIFGLTYYSLFFYDGSIGIVNSVKKMMIGQQGMFHYIIVTLILLGLINALFKNQIRKIFRVCYDECLEAFGVDRLLGKKNSARN